jgi:hypothetical protein
MELECIKFNEKVPADDAYCRHPDDYCKYRTSCIIYFMEKENRRSGSRNIPGNAEAGNDNHVPLNDD